MSGILTDRRGVLPGSNADTCTQSARQAWTQHANEQPIEVGAGKGRVWRLKREYSSLINLRMFL